MRRDSSEGEWEFGSWRLAFLAIVLALLAATLFAFVVPLRMRDGISQTIPVRPPSRASVIVPPSVADDPPSRANTPVVVPPMGQVGLTPPAPVDRRPRTPAPPARATTVPSRSPPVVVPEVQATSATPQRPVPVQSVPRAVETARPTEVGTTSSERALPPSPPEADRKSTSGVDRRDTRRAVREASDAIRDIRSR